MEHIENKEINLVRPLESLVINQNIKNELEPILLDQTKETQVPKIKLDKSKKKTKSESLLKYGPEKPPLKKLKKFYPKTKVLIKINGDLEKEIYVNKVCHMATYFLKEQKIQKIPRKAVNELYLFIEFLLYNYPNKKLQDFTNNFLDNAINLFFDLSEEGIQKLFITFPPEISTDKLHKLEEIISLKEIKQIIFTLEQQIQNSNNSENYLVENKVLLEILKEIPPGLISYHLKNTFNHLLIEAKKEYISDKTTKKTGYISQTTLFSRIGLELLVLYKTKKISTMLNFQADAIRSLIGLINKKNAIENLSEETLSKMKKNIDDTKLKVNFPERGLMAFFTTFYTTEVLKIIKERELKEKRIKKELKEEQKKPKILQNLNLIENFQLELKEIQINKEPKMSKTIFDKSKELIILLGSLLFSFLENKKIGNSFVFNLKKINKKVDNNIFVEYFYEINPNFFSGIDFKNMPSFNEDLCQFTPNEESKEIREEEEVVPENQIDPIPTYTQKRIFLNMGSYGSYQKNFKTLPQNEQIKVDYIGSENIANLNFIGKQKYILNEPFAKQMFLSTRNFTLESAEIFYDLNFAQLKKDLKPNDFKILCDLCLINNYTITLKNNNFVKNIRSYEASRNKLFLKVSGKKLLLKSVHAEYKILKAFSYRKQKDKLIRNYYYFPIFFDPRNRIYIGNSLLSPMASERYSNYIKVDITNKCDYFEKAQQIHTFIRDFDNIFMKKFNEDPESKDYLKDSTRFQYYITKKFEENHAEIAKIFFLNPSLKNQEVTFDAFLKLQKTQNKKITKEIFKEYNQFLDFQKFLQNPKSIYDIFFCLDCSSSGIQLSGLTLNSETLLNFSNILGTTKNQGYLKIHQNLYENFFNKLEEAFFERGQNDKLYFDYDDYFFDVIFNLLNKCNFLRKLDFREILFLDYCRRNNKKMFDSTFSLTLIKTNAIASLYGQKSKGFSDHISEHLISNFLVDTFKISGTIFFEKEKTSIKIEEESINKRLEKLENQLKVMILKEKEKKDKKIKKDKNQEIEERKKYKKMKKEIKFKIKCLSSLKEQEPLKLFFDNVATKLHIEIIKNSAMKDCFSRMAPIFSNLVDFRVLKEDLIKENDENQMINEPFKVINKDFAFSMYYFEQKTDRIDTQYFSLDREEIKINIRDKSRKISIKRKLQDLDYKRLKITLISSTVQSWDAEVLNSFITFCRDPFINIPTFVKHDNFGIPYYLFPFLRILVAESFLKINWKTKLYTFCLENAMTFSFLKISTFSELKMLFLMVKIKFLIYPKIFEPLFKIFVKHFKKVRRFKDITLSSDFLDGFLPSLKETDLKLQVFLETDEESYNYRKRMTNPYFIK